MPTRHIRQGIGPLSAYLIHHKTKPYLRAMASVVFAIEDQREKDLPDYRRGRVASTVQEMTLALEIATGSQPKSPGTVRLDTSRLANNIHQLCGLFVFIRVELLHPPNSQGIFHLHEVQYCSLVQVEPLSSFAEI